MCCVSISAVCVHWGWGMWVGKILKMESAFVRVVLRLMAKADEATLLTSRKALFPGVVCTSLLSNHQLNHCGALCVSFHREAFASCYVTSSLSQSFFFSSTVNSSRLFVSSVNISPLRGVGVFIRLPAEIQPPRKKVTQRCCDPSCCLGWVRYF